LTTSLAEAPSVWQPSKNHVVAILDRKKDLYPLGPRAPIAITQLLNFGIDSAIMES
jgi:hypothetical protein